MAAARVAQTQVAPLMPMAPPQQRRRRRRQQVLAAAMRTAGSHRRRAWSDTGEGGFLAWGRMRCLAGLCLWTNPGAVLKRSRASCCVVG